MARIDGKYEELREIGRSGAEKLLEVRAPDGTPLRLGWFDVSTPAARANFYRYRAALRDLAPAGLLDVVARPGAHYALWRPVPGTPLSEYLTASARDAETVDAVRDLATRMQGHGYALQDAEIVLEGGTPHLARLAPAERSPEEAEALNAEDLRRLSGGRLRRRPRRTERPRSDAPPVSLWGFMPGLVMLVAGVALGVQATKTYLTPQSKVLPAVVGLGAQQAAETLAREGFVVQFAEGENPERALGTVIGQEPGAESALVAGRTVTLTINNPPALTVPRVEDLTLEQARAALGESTLQVGDVLSIDGGPTGTPRGRVIAQLPASGATAARGQRVTLLVSGGVTSQQTWLPDLRGLDFEAARQLVRKAGLVVSRVDTRDSNARENTILSQSPDPFTKVDAGSPVTLVLARTPLAQPADPVPSLPLTPPVATPDPQADPLDETQTAPGDGDLLDGAAPLTNADPADLEPRTIPLSYTFPGDLPEGTAEITVRDADGERTAMSPQPTELVEGSRAEGNITVRGPAVFSVRVNGREIDSFEQ